MQMLLGMAGRRDDEDEEAPNSDSGGEQESEIRQEVLT